MKKKQIIYFRADGNLKIGYGHVIRSLALVEMVQKYDCRFVINTPDDFLKNEIQKVCTTLIELPVFKTLKDEANYISENILDSNDIIVLDGYQYNDEYQRIVKNGCGKLVCIDDIYKEHFYSDVVINHAEGIASSKYKKEWYTKLFLGSKYAILRPPFFQSNNTSLKSKINKKRIFINMGGTDSKNYTIKALQQSLKLDDIQEIDIVVGQQYPFKDELVRKIQSNSDVPINLHINVNARKMALLMRKSTLGICAASSVSYEYASIGGLMFVYKTADNQKNIYSFLLKEKIAFPIEKLQERSSKILGSIKALDRYSKHKKLFFSGNSTNNLKQIFLKLSTECSLSIRKATSKDLMVYYHWANDKDVRNNAINKEFIPLESHKLWFKSRLNDNKAFLYLFQKGKKNVGQVRIELTPKGVAEIDFSVDKKLRGKGYSEIILRKAIFSFGMEYSKAVMLRGVVKRGNIPSQKAFINNAFVNKRVVRIKGESYYDLLLKLNYANR